MMTSKAVVESLLNLTRVLSSLKESAEKGYYSLRNLVYTSNTRAVA